MSLNILFSLLIFNLTSIAQTPNLDTHPAASVKHWGNFKQKKIEEKVFTKLPKELEDYFSKANSLRGRAARPSAVKPTEDFKVDLMTAIATIPERVRKLINPKLVGIFVAKDLGTTALANYVVNKKGQQVAGYIILDMMALDKKANEWATWRKLSPFTFDPSYSLIAEIASQEEDSRVEAIRYILLHEFGHVLAIGHEHVAPWGVEATELNPLSQYAFTQLSWDLKNEEINSKYGNIDVTYYADEEKKTDSKRIRPIYQNLAKTNFPTLYASTNASEDFAESFANYVHVIMLKKPWVIKIRSPNKDELIFRSCWREKRCEEKRKALEKILDIKS